MAVINSIVSWFIKKRMHQIELFERYPHEVQLEWFSKLIDSAKGTEWGGKYGYTSITTEEEFRNRVPVQEYEDIKPYVERLRKGEQNILWPSEIRWFAKSSGTTGGKSKFYTFDSQRELNHLFADHKVTFWCSTCYCRRQRR